MDIIRAYTETTNGTADVAFAFIRKHRRDVSRQLLHEMMLNYRSYFKPKQKDRIVQDYKKYIIGKTQKHKSDLVIGYNIVTMVRLPTRNEEYIVDYLYDRLQDQFPKSIRSNYKLKKYFVLPNLLDHL